jgi:hypothetical protein
VVGVGSDRTPAGNCSVPAVIPNVMILEIDTDNWRSSPQRRHTGGPGQRVVAAAGGKEEEAGSPTAREKSNMLC